MSFRYDAITAREILDSRGRPTVQVGVQIAGGTLGAAAVPSGASTGSREAVEHRDGDQRCFGGAGVRVALDAVQGEIARRLRGGQWESLADVDRAMIDLDGTPDKRRLGANAIVGVSMATARALAASEDRPLYRWLGVDGAQPRLPVPHFNVVNGACTRRMRLSSRSS